MSSPSAPGPGWYPDPAAPDTQRYWVGDEWLGEPIPVGATPPATPPTRPAPAPDPAPAPPVPNTGATGWAPGQDSPGTRPDPNGGGAHRQPSDQPRAGVPWRRPGPTGIELPPVPPGHVRVPGSTAVVKIDTAKLAPLGLRVAARLLDLVGITLLCLVVNSYFIVRLFREIEPLTAEIQRGNASDIPPNASRLVWTILFISVALWFAYEVPGTANSGQTLGKRLVGIKVVRIADDSMLTFGQSFRRWLILMFLSPVFSSVCGLPFLLIDLVWCIWDKPARQTLHDKLVSSIVVRAPEPGATVDAPPADPPSDGGKAL